MGLQTPPSKEEKATRLLNRVSVEKKMHVLGPAGG